MWDCRLGCWLVYAVEGGCRVTVWDCWLGCWLVHAVEGGCRVTFGDCWLGHPWLCVVVSGVHICKEMRLVGGSFISRFSIAVQVLSSIGSPGWRSDWVHIFGFLFFV